LLSETIKQVLDLSTTEKNHVDQLKDHAFPSARSRHRFGRDGRSQARSASSHRGRAASPGKRLAHLRFGAAREFGEWPLYMRIQTIEIIKNEEGD
jgi:hypothetical protein